MGSCVSSPTRENPPVRPTPPSRPQGPTQPQSSQSTGVTGPTDPTPAEEEIVTPTYPPPRTETPVSDTTRRKRRSLLPFRRSSTDSFTRRQSSSMGGRQALNVLRTYATLPSPSTSLPANVLLTSTPNTIAIFDAYPKAKYHFLVLPRYPFPPQSNPESTHSIVKLENLDDLRSLLLKSTRDEREDVIASMAEAAREVEEMVRDEMMKTEGFEWKVDVGFHAIPSMKHIHLHVISEDRVAPALKTKKHHNSFRPDLGFFVPLVEVQRWIQQDEEYIHERVGNLQSAETLLDSPLTCFKCDEPFSTMPKLKSHMEKEFQKEKKIALDQIRRHGRQRSSDDSEDMF